MVKQRPQRDLAPFALRLRRIAPGRPLAISAAVIRHRRMTSSKSGLMALFKSRFCGKTTSPTGFEPVLTARKAGVLDRARRWGQFFHSPHYTKSKPSVLCFLTLYSAPFGTPHLLSYFFDKNQVGSINGSTGSPFHGRDIVQRSNPHTDMLIFP